MNILPFPYTWRQITQVKSTTIMFFFLDGSLGRGEILVLVQVNSALKRSALILGCCRASALQITSLPPS